MHVLFPTRKHEDLDVVVMTSTKILISNYDKFFLCTRRVASGTYLLSVLTGSGEVYLFNTARGFPFRMHLSSFLYLRKYSQTCI